LAGKVWSKAEDDWLTQNSDKYATKKLLYSVFDQIFPGGGLEGMSTRTIKLKINRAKQMKPTQFGMVNRREVPIGTERAAFVTGNYKTVYVKVKLTEGREKTTGYSEPYWKAKQKKTYEDHYGPVRKGKIVVFLDRNPENFDINNLYCVDRKILAIMNQNKWFTHDREHTLTAIKWCELFYALKEEKRDNLQGD